MNTIWISIIPTLIGIIAGVATQYILSMYSEKRKRNADLKMQAYIDLIQGVSHLGIASKSNDEGKKREYQIKLLDAKSKVVVYGSKKVISELSTFYKEASGRLSHETDKDIFIKVYQAIRQEYQKEKILDEEIDAILF